MLALEDRHNPLEGLHQRGLLTLSNVTIAAQGAFDGGHNRIEVAGVVAENLEEGQPCTHRDTGYLLLLRGLYEVIQQPIACYAPEVATAVIIGTV